MEAIWAEVTMGLEKGFLSKRGDLARDMYLEVVCSIWLV